MQSLKTGLDILKSAGSLQFHFADERWESGLPRELQGLFENSGKRFRPALVFLMGEVFNLPESKLNVFARAVEMTHTASLVHDDVIDEASERRKSITLNHRFNNTMAVLAGDFLLSHVIHELTLEGHSEITVDLTLAIKELADGEWLQAKLKEKSAGTWAELTQVAYKKTGSLMAWSCATPAKIAGLKSEEIKACYDLGNDVGLFFQILDDINDFNPKSGKPFAADLMNGQLNFVTSHMVTTDPSVRVEFKRFTDTGQLGHGVPLKEALAYVINMTKKLEDELNSRFALIAGKRAPHTLPIFKRMLEKVREGFTPS